MSPGNKVAPVSRSPNVEGMSATRTILITGSAKRLGAALAQGLARDGHRIALHFRTSRAEAGTTQEAILRAKGICSLFQSPLASLADGDRLVDEVIRHFGALDTLINNAGTYNRKTFDELTQEDWDAGFASTAGAAFYTTRAALPYLRACGRGRIVNIGDAMSDRPGFTEPAMSYYIGKTGVWMMTQTLAYTEARHGITVNMVSPGVIADSICRTPLEEMPGGRYTTSEDVLHPIRFLLGDSSGMLSGSNLHVAGGWNTAPLFPNVLRQAGYTKRLPPDNA
jgi:NAD(P)-dependent dehydrogenase (short-subunit alcohol dehydrogenase family)